MNNKASDLHTRRRSIFQPKWFYLAMPLFFGIANVIFYFTEGSDLSLIVGVGNLAIFPFILDDVLDC